MGRMGLQKAVQLKNGAVILTFAHGRGEKSLRTVTAGGELSLPQVARLVGTHHLRVWRAVQAKVLQAVRRSGKYRVTVKEAGRWGRTLKAGS
jgi:hypothetical protein